MNFKKAIYESIIRKCLLFIAFPFCDLHKLKVQKPMFIFFCYTSHFRFPTILIKYKRLTAFVIIFKRYSPRQLGKGSKQGGK